MKTLIKNIALTATMLVAATQSHAAVFDFIDLIDNNNGVITGTLANGTAFGPANSNEQGFEEFSWVDDGITLSVEASSTTDSTTFAYLDAFGAGLGVCKNTTKFNQCDPGNDDNAQVGEVIHLGFDQTVDIDFNFVTFKDADHNTLIPTALEVLVDAGNYVALNVTSILTGNAFKFRTTDNAQQFYIGSLGSVRSTPTQPPVSVSTPANLGLLAVGLAGLVLTRKRAAALKAA